MGTFKWCGMIEKSKPVEAIHLECVEFVSKNGHPFNKQLGHNLFCWFRHLERVSFFIPAERLYETNYFHRPNLHYPTWFCCDCICLRVT